MTLIEWQIRSGVSGLLVCGEAGEAPTLTLDERCTIIQTAVEVADRAVPVLVGCGTNSTETTIALTSQARALMTSTQLTRPCARTRRSSPTRNVRTTSARHSTGRFDG